jgi:hypothetical protein
MNRCAANARCKTPVADDGQKRSAFAFEVAADIMGCWTEHDSPPGRARTTPSEGYRPHTEPLGFPMREPHMADKSPRHSMSKKSGKSIKEKRVERKAKADTTPQMERLTRDKKP